MNRVYVHGSFMTDNFGDFLLYEVTRRSLIAKFSDIEVVARNVSPAYDRFTGVKRVSLRSVRKVEFAVFTGGGYFGGPGGFAANLLYLVEFLRFHLPAIAVVLVRRIPYTIVGVGVGPIRSLILRRIAGVLFRNARSVTVRDQESRAYVVDKLRVNREVAVVPDLVIGIDDGVLPELANMSVDANGRRYRLGLHLVTRPTPGDAHARVIKGVNAALKSVEQNPSVVVMLCDQYGSKQTSRALERGAMIEGADVEVHEYTSPWTLIDDIAACDVVVTDKLHVGIVAVKLGKPVLSVASHRKALRFYRQSGRERFCLPLSAVEVGQVAALLEDLMVAKDVEDQERSGLPAGTGHAFDATFEVMSALGV